MFRDFSDTIDDSHYDIGPSVVNHMSGINDLDEGIPNFLMKPLCLANRVDELVSSAGDDARRNGDVIIWPAQASLNQKKVGFERG